MTPNTMAQYMTTNEAGTALAYTRQHVAHLVRTNILTGVRFGRDVLVLRESVADYQEKYHGHRKTGRKIETNAETLALA